MEKYLQIEIATLKKLLRAFPKSFINHNLEFIAEPRTNQYLILENCDDFSIKCRVLETLSRAASFALPYKTTKRNETYNAEMRKCINAFLETEFTKEDMELIYEVLGNGVRHQLTVDFVESGYDMALLREIRG